MFATIFILCSLSPKEKKPKNMNEKLDTYSSSSLYYTTPSYRHSFVKHWIHELSNYKP